MTRRIFIYEDTCGGGCEKLLAAQLHREGMAMLRGLAEDFASIEDVEVVTTLDKRIDPGGLPLEPLPVSSPEESAAKFDILAAQCDLSLIVAPELGGRLAGLSRRVVSLGGKLHGGDLELIETASDKLRLYRHLDAAGIPALPARKVQPGRRSREPVVQKPRFGAGSLEITTLAPGRAERESEESMIVTPLLDGQAASVLCIAGGGSIIHLEPCRQRLSEDGSFRYLGGSFPLGEAGLSERARTLALAAIDSFRSPKGFIGVDLVLGATGKDDRVIEINPRPTTSYCALRRRSSINLARLSLDLPAGGEPGNPSWPTAPQNFDSEGNAEGTGGAVRKPTADMETVS